MNTQTQFIGNSTQRLGPNSTKLGRTPWFGTDPLTLQKIEYITKRWGKLTVSVMPVSRDGVQLIKISNVNQFGKVQNINDPRGRQVLAPTLTEAIDMAVERIAHNSRQRRLERRYIELNNLPQEAKRAYVETAELVKKRPNVHYSSGYYRA